MSPTESRAALLSALASRIPHGFRPIVAVDGVDGAGKTTFADSLAEVLRASGRDVVRASVDGFHQPREVRHRRGRHSPEGFWLDSFDLTALCAELLDPFAAGDAFRTAVHDVDAERSLYLDPVDAPASSVLVLDGLFLHRDELAGRWDFSVFLDVAFEISVPRMAFRDGSPADPAASGNRRYVEGQRLYFAACSPWKRAAVVVDNNDHDRPFLR